MKPSIKAVSYLTIAPAIILLAAACGGGGPDVGCSGGPVRVVVTLPVFADFACRVGGDRVTVTALIPPDADPHTFAPEDEAASEIKAANLILYNGLALEQPATDFILHHARGTAQLIAYAGSVPSPSAPQQAPPITAQAAGDNPHLWLDVEAAKVYVDATRDSLEIVDPDGTAEYRQRTDAYLAELTALAQEIEQAVGSIPDTQRRLVTSHDSFPHFARRSGMEVLGFLALTAEDTPTQGQLDALVDKAVDAGLGAVFADRGPDSSVMEQIAVRAGAALCSLYSDQVDEAADTYIEMMRANAQELVRCLKGS